MLAWVRATALVAVPSGLVGSRIGQRNTGAAGVSSHCQQQALHLGSEFAALGLFGGKGNKPIGKGAHVAHRHHLIEQMVLRPHRLTGMANPNSQADQRIEPEACSDLKFTISPPEDRKS